MREWCSVDFTSSKWDETKASSNERKHAVTFELASSIFADPRVSSLSQISNTAKPKSDGSQSAWRAAVPFCLAYLWSEIDRDTVQVRIISARRATRAEIREYGRNL